MLRTAQQVPAAHGKGRATGGCAATPGQQLVREALCVPNHARSREVLQRARADSDLAMIRNWDRDGSIIGTPLHDHVTASLPDYLEAMLLKNATQV